MYPGATGTANIFLLIYLFIILQTCIRERQERRRKRAVVPVEQSLLSGLPHRHAEKRFRSVLMLCYFSAGDRYCPCFVIEMNRYKLFEDSYCSATFWRGN